MSMVAFALLLLLSTGVGSSLAEGTDTSAPDLPTAEQVKDAPSTTEVASLRTATSRTFRLPDGQLEAHLFTAPIHYLDSKGRWQEIDNRLLRSAAGGVENVANALDLRLPERLGAGETRLSVDGQWVSSRLLGKETGAATVAADVATYADAAGVEFQLTSASTGVKEEIVLSNASQPHAFHFVLDASENLSPRLEDDGSVSFRDAAGRLVVRLPTPTVLDSAADALPESSPVAYSLDDLSNGNWKLGVEVDSAWLSSPDRQWPVTVDPSLVAPKSLAALDCQYFVRLPSGETNETPTCGLNGATTEKAEYTTSAGITSRYRSALRFNLSAIPAKASVASAGVNLYSPQTATGVGAVQLRRSTQNWDETLNWDNYENRSGGKGFPWMTPGGDFTSEGSEISTAVRGTAAGWWQFADDGMKHLVSRWLEGAVPNQGVIVKLADETPCGTSCTRGTFKFSSSTSSPEANRPYLAVNYYPPAPSTSNVTSPSEGTVTAKRLKLEAGWSAAGVTGITFQFREGRSGWFQTIPSELVKKANGQAVSWPLALSGVNKSEPLFFDVAHASSTLRSNGGSVQVRAVFEGPPGVAGYSAPVEATVNKFVGGPRDATVTVGPGSVDLLTGNLSVRRTDVAIPGLDAALEFSRTANSRDPGKTGETTVLGQGWKAGVPVEAAGGAAWKSVKLINFTESLENQAHDYAYARVTDLSGYELAFEKVGESYVAPPEAAGYLLESEASGTRFRLTDLDGNRTTFENSAGGSEYLPVSVSQLGGSDDSTRMVYQLVGGQRRLSMIVAPSPSELECTETNATTTKGCHALTFHYVPASTWGAPSSYGERLSTIKYHAPGFGGPWEVSKYAYDSQGRLTQQWDPRISPVLKEAYAYEAAGRLSTITPPGEEPWTMEYGVLDEESDGGRLIAVKRPSLLSSPSNAQTTIAYGVPLAGSGAPYDMSSATVAQWGQQDIPVDATAVFPPDQIPSSPPTSYARASVYYMDAEGFGVNVATPSGAGTSAPSITTTETDTFGNVIRELGAQNRLRALAAGSESVTRSHQLASKRLYSPDGLDVMEEWGPLHEVKLESGATVQARTHKTVQYDDGAPTPPSGMPMPHLPTRETVGASIPGQGVDADQRVTEYTYNWNLRKLLQTIIDPTGLNDPTALNIRTTTVYDQTGLPVEHRQPSDTAGTGAGTTKIVYYTAGSGGGKPHGECAEKPEYASLPCLKIPAAQPGGTAPELLTTRYLAYNQFGQVTEAIERPGEAGANTRKTIRTYDAAGRLKTTRHEGGGLALPATETTYSSTTGRATGQKFVCTSSCESFDAQAVTTTYDTLGRPIAYQDADGNTSSTTYDLLGRRATTNDGRGTQTFSYDQNSGLLVQMTDSGVGTFTANYDADGNMVEQVLPNGLAAKTSYNEVGAAIHLSYEKVTYCTISCTWLDFHVEESIHGQWLAQTSTLSSQQYSYDKAGRLKVVKDTSKAGNCSTRTYSYDVNSNRKSLVSRAPGIGGVCDLSSAGSIQNYEYDPADRLIGANVVYDDFGRIASLPTAYSGGGTLTSAYYSNDLLRTQAQDGITNTYELDSSLRQRQRTRSGAQNGTDIFHYADGSDAPAWIDRGASWERNVVGIDGGLAATQNSGGGVWLALLNLHGDVTGVVGPNPEATKPAFTFQFDEFGNRKSTIETTWGWLGGKMRRTELPSGVIQMGVRSYVPAMGRFISVDPESGGSANSYDYGMADPINSLDLDGRKVKRKSRSRTTRVGTASSNVRVALALSMSDVRGLIRNLKSFLGDHLQIAWNTCIPTKELSSVTMVKAAFLSDCVPKVRDYILYPQEIAAAKLNGWAWCLVVNSWASFRSVVSMAVATVRVGGFCSGNDGERPWAYVKHSAFVVPG